MLRQTKMAVAVGCGLYIFYAGGGVQAKSGWKFKMAAAVGCELYTVYAGSGLLAWLKEVSTSVIDHIVCVSFSRPS